MALESTVQWEVQGTGSDNNGGGFDDTYGTPGTDYTYGAGQTVISWLSSGGTYTNDLECTNTTPSVVASSSRNFIAADVGNIINLTGGTNVVTGRYQIKSVSSNTATLDRNAMSGAGTTDGSGYLGGALASLGGLGAALENVGEAGHIAHMKYYASGYSISSTSANVSNGGLDLYNSGSARMTGKKFALIGYNTTRGDYGTKPEITVSSAPTYCIVQGGWTTGQQVCANLLINGNSSGTHGISARSISYGAAIMVDVTGFDDTNEQAYSSIRMLWCKSYDNYRGCGSCSAYNCWFDDCFYGLYYTSAAICVISNVKSGGYGMYHGTGSYSCNNCTFYNTPSHAIYQASASYGGTFWNNLFHTIGGSCFYNLSYGTAYNCAVYNATSGRGSLTIDANPISCTSDPLVNPSGDDFRLNTDPNGGALCRDAGYGIIGVEDYASVGAIGVAPGGRLHIIGG